MFQRAPISSSSDPQRASVKIVPPSRRTFSISTVPQRREKNGRRASRADFFYLGCTPRTLAVQDELAVVRH
jgi:hypothetical protein